MFFDFPSGCSGFRWESLTRAPWRCPPAVAIMSTLPCSFPALLGLRIMPRCHWLPGTHIPALSGSVYQGKNSPWANFISKGLFIMPVSHIPSAHIERKVLCAASAVYNQSPSFFFYSSLMPIALSFLFPPHAHMCLQMRAIAGAALLPGTLSPPLTSFRSFSNHT